MAAGRLGTSQLVAMADDAILARRQSCEPAATGLDAGEPAWRASATHGVQLAVRARQQGVSATLT